MILLPSNESLREVLFWLAGGLDSRSWEHVHIATPLILGGALVLLILARDLNLLMLGDDEARSMGVRVGPTRVIMLLAASLATGAAVAVSGTIVFVGLVAPHTLRLILGPDNRVLIPMSALGGAVFVIVADTIARTVIEPAELRVGILTALVGAPFFILLLIRTSVRCTRCESGGLQRLRPSRCWDRGTERVPGQVGDWGSYGHTTWRVDSWPAPITVSAEGFRS